MSNIQLLLGLLLAINNLWLIRGVPFIIAKDSVDEDDTVEIVSNAIDGDENPESHDLSIDLRFYGDNLYGTPDTKATGKLVANYSLDNSSGANPEELGSYLEGDILIPATSQGRAFARNGVTSASSRWPKGVVPFEIRGNFNSRDLSIIEQAIGEYHRRTCIRFVPHTSERDYVSLVNGNSGCWSSVGRIGGKQEVNLQSPGCLTKPGTAMHELMHALGFLHEQNRHERDDYVTIQYQNIQPNAKPNFDRAKSTNAYGVPYDYGSVMHYSANAFSINGRPTIVATQATSSNARMGQRDGFSPMDIEKVNKMYACDMTAKPAATTTTTTTGTTNNNNVVNSFLGGLINGLGLGR